MPPGVIRKKEKAESKMQIRQVVYPLNNKRYLGKENNMRLN